MADAARGGGDKDVRRRRDGGGGIEVEAAEGVECG